MRRVRRLEVVRTFFARRDFLRRLSASRVEQGQPRVRVDLPVNWPGVRGQHDLDGGADRCPEQVPAAGRAVAQAQRGMNVEERLAVEEGKVAGQL
jgi:hypothetical protein